jgi:hypothetical protein
MGVAAMSSIPAYLNTTNPNIKALRDVTEKDKIALNAVKISIPAIIMQMAARQEFGPSETFRYDKYTVSMTHPDGVAALLSGISEVNLHFTSVSYHLREIKDPRVRTIMSTDDVMGGSTTFTMLSTTTKFRDENPITYKALMLALKDAIDCFVERSPQCDHDGASEHVQVRTLHARHRFAQTPRHFLERSVLPGYPRSSRELMPTRSVHVLQIGYALFANRLSASRSRRRKPRAGDGSISPKRPSSDNAFANASTSIPR